VLNTYDEKKKKKKIIKIGVILFQARGYKRAGEWQSFRPPY
jgi:hypothetical protein